MDDSPKDHTKLFDVERNTSRAFLVAELVKFFLLEVKFCSCID